MADLPLFAYGTLLTGALDPAIDRLLVRQLGTARLRGRLHDQGGYPGLLCGPTNGGWVHGVLFALDEPARTLARLDRYEGYDTTRPQAGEFIRVMRRVVTADAPRDAWVYLLNPRRSRPGPRITGGDWRRYRNHSNRHWQRSASDRVLNVGAAPRPR